MNTMMGFLFGTLAMGLLCSASDFGGCYPEAHACKVLRRHWRQEHVPLLKGIPERPVYTRCPEFKLQSSSQDYSNRSLSPWRYRVDEDKTRFPEKIAVAECLCAGCIINGKEDTEYNSVPVMQTMMIVRKQECSEKGKYSFRTEWKRVPVACTCVMHRSLN